MKWEHIVTIFQWTRKLVGAVCSALTNQWPALIALIADTNFKIYLDSFSLSCSVWWNIPPGIISYNFSLWWNISTSSSAPYTLLVLKWLLLCHYYYYCRQTRLSKTSKMINYEDWDWDWDWSLAGQVTKTPEMLRQNVFTVKYRVLETRDILYPDKSLLIGCSCHPPQLDIPHHHCIVLPCSAMLLQISERPTATFINQVKRWPCYC